MSKVKSRNIRTLSTCNLTFDHPLLSKEQYFFGEEVSKNSPLLNEQFNGLQLSNDESLDSLIGNIRDLSVSKSSSSSLSWEADEENETTKIVKEELDRMERVLTGQENIPETYDSDEYTKWMTHFPRFCITGKGLKGIPIEQSNKYYEEIIAIDPEDEYIPKTSKVSESTLRETIIDHLYVNLCNRLNDNDVGKTKPIEPLPPLTIDVDDYLKVSPILNQLPERHLSKRGYSSRSLISSQISSSKWLKEDTNEYTSLPFLVENFTMDSNLYNNNKNQNKHPKSILKANFVLPPIDQYRSVSATPRRGIRYPSSISVNGCRSRIESGRFIGKSGRRIGKNKSCGDDRLV